MAWPTKQHYLSHINEIPPWGGGRGGEKKTPSRSLVSGVHVKIGTRSICLCKCQTPVMLESVRKASKIIQHLCHEINQPSATLITQRTKQRGWGGIKAVINFSPDIFVKTLTSSYTPFITQTHLADRCPVCYTLSHFIPAKRSKTERRGG